MSTNLRVLREVTLAERVASCRATRLSRRRLRGSLRDGRAFVRLPVARDLENPCLDHCGAASYLSDYQGVEFLRMLWRAAADSMAAPIGRRWPRGPRRGHFRDALGREAVVALHERYGGEPEAMVRYICGPAETDRTTTFAELFKRVSAHKGFDEKICFWVADMVDRVLGMQVAFDQGSILRHNEALKAADLAWTRYYKENYRIRPGRQERRLLVIDGLTQKLSDLTSSPLDDRPVGVQEAATILCKWKRHWRRNYPLFYETREVATALDEWSTVTDTAARLRLFLPRNE